MIPFMLKAWQETEGSRAYKKDLFIINEGDLFKYVDEALRRTFGVESKAYAYARERIPPINILQKLVSKLSRIYNNPPTRVMLGTDQDSELMGLYIDEMNFDAQMDLANENYNLTKISLIMPSYDTFSDELNLKVLPSHNFLPFSDDTNNPQRMTRLMTYQGERKNRLGNVVQLFYAYSDEEFIAFTSDGETAHDIMSLNDGVNIFGRIPAVYLSKSRTKLYPYDDTDMKQMVVLLPSLLADLNLASMFSCFSITYGIDINDENLKYAPNAFWSLKSDPSSDKKPEIGTIKPEADIDKTLTLITTQLSLWLNSKGLRANSIGDMTAENFASGISKMIDESDAIESLKKQSQAFKRAEERELWDLIMHYMHPVWVSQGLATNQFFSPDAKVKVNFPSQESLRSRADVVSDVKAEFDAGFITLNDAIARLNPDMTPADIEEYIVKLNGLSVVNITD